MSDEPNDRFEADSTMIDVVLPDGTKVPFEEYMKQREAIDRENFKPEN